MTTVTAWHCDAPACGTEIPAEQHGTMLRLITSDRGELHFCGPRCLADWAKAEVKAQGRP